MSGMNLAQFMSDALALIERIDDRVRNVLLNDAGPSRSLGELGQVLLRLDTDRGGLHSKREVFCYKNDGAIFSHQVSSDGQDAGVIGAIAKKTGGQS